MYNSWCKNPSWSLKFYLNWKIFFLQKTWNVVFIDRFRFRDFLLYGWVMVLLSISFPLTYEFTISAYCVFHDIFKCTILSVIPSFLGMSSKNENNLKKSIIRIERVYNVRAILCKNNLKIWKCMWEISWERSHRLKLSFKCFRVISICS